MKTILRVLLLLAMVPLAWQAVHCYAFDFEEGYPLWPLLALSGCFWSYLRLRPIHGGTSYRNTHYSVDSVLLLIFAVLSSAFVLKMRGEAALQPLWFLHLATLTFFQLLLPYLAAHRFNRAHGWVTATVAILLLGLLWKGTEGQRQRQTEGLDSRSLQETRYTFTPAERRG